MFEFCFTIVLLRPVIIVVVLERESVKALGAISVGSPYVLAHMGSKLGQNF